MLCLQDDADSGYSGSGGSAGFTLTKEEICNKIHAYNKSVGQSSGAMTLVSTIYAYDSAATSTST